MKYIYLLIIFLVAMVSPVSAFEIGKEKSYWIKCNSNSMYPTFDCDSRLNGYYISDKYNISIGTIIWFSSYGYYSKVKSSFIVHRIIGIDYDSKGMYYITKGDNNDISDYEAWGIKVRPYAVLFRVEI